MMKQMRILGLVAVLALVLAGSAIAGNLSNDNGQPSWQSSQCTKPTVPPAIANLDPETRGDELNSLVSKYNEFADASLAYMQCINDEMQRDSAKLNQAITNGAQKSINEMQDTVAKVGEPFHRARDRR